MSDTPNSPAHRQRKKKRARQAQRGTKNTQAINTGWIKLVFTDADTGERMPGASIYLSLPERFKGKYRADEDGALLFVELAKEEPFLWAGFPFGHMSSVLRRGAAGVLSVAEDIVKTSTDIDALPGKAPKKERGDFRHYAVGSLVEHRVGDDETLPSIAKTYTDAFQGGGLDVVVDADGLGAFNFGATSADGKTFREAVTAYTGCTRFDDAGPIFSNECEPGVLYVPDVFLWPTDENLGIRQIEKNCVYEVKLKPFARHVDLELQTVDETNVHRANIPLELWSASGDPIELTTDDWGYWKGEDIEVSGFLKVTRPDGSVVPEAKRAQVFGRTSSRSRTARLDPMLARQTIVSLCVNHLPDEDQGRRDMLRRRYTSVPQKGLPIVPNPKKRSFGCATDNLFMIAGWDESSDALDMNNLCEQLSEWCKDRHPVVHKRGFCLLAFMGRNAPGGDHAAGGGWELRAYEVSGGKGTEKHRWPLKSEWGTKALYGAYADFMVGALNDPFIDMTRQALLVAPFYKDGQAVKREDEAGRTVGIPLAELLELDDVRDYAVFMQSQFPKTTITYLCPATREHWVGATRDGGSGVLEDYPEPGHQSFDRIHERNKAVLKAANRAYQAYLNGYIESVEEIREHRSKAPADKETMLRELGPPYSPFQFPLPFGLEDFKAGTGPRLDLAELIIKESSLKGWKAVADLLNKIWERRAAASLWLSLEMEPVGEVMLRRGAHVTGGLAVANVKANVGETFYVGAEGELKGNLHIDPETGDLTYGQEWFVKVGRRDVDIWLGGKAGVPALGHITARAALQSDYAIKINTKTGEYRRVFELSGGVGTYWRGLAKNKMQKAVEKRLGKTKFTLVPTFEIELDDAGDFRFRLGDYQLDGNFERGTFGICRCIKRPLPIGAKVNLITETAEVATENKICVCARAKFIDRDLILAAMPGMPGFFERVGLTTLLHPSSTWNHLPEPTREALVILGWTQDKWNRKGSKQHGVPSTLTTEDWPKSVRTRWVDFPPTWRWAAVRLGFHMEDWSLWVTSVGAPIALPLEELGELGSVGVDIAKDAGKTVAADFIAEKVLKDKLGPLADPVADAGVEAAADYFGDARAYIETLIGGPIGIDPGLTDELFDLAKEGLGVVDADPGVEGGNESLVQ